MHMQLIEVNNASTSKDFIQVNVLMNTKELIMQQAALVFLIASMINLLQINYLMLQKNGCKARVWKQWMVL